MADMEHAKEWLDYAQRDYDFAVDVESNFWPKHMEKICYFCQQSTEKALKAVLAYNEVSIPKTHNITELIEKCSKFDSSIQMEEKVSIIMTAYATVSRYPDNVTSWNDDDAKLALKYAKSTLEMIRKGNYSVAPSNLREKDEPNKASRIAINAGTPCLRAVLI